MSFYFFLSGFATIGIATLLYIWMVASKQADFGRYGTIFAWLGVVFLAGSLITRWVAAGHGPFSNMYEYSLSFAWGISLSYVLVERRYKARSLGAFVLPVAAILLWYASTLPSQIDPLMPALQNNWLLSLHVSVAIISYGIFTVSFGSAVMYLIQTEKNRIRWMPPATLLDEVSYKSVIIGFPFFALVIILGAYWAQTAWGRYWGWDPKETASLVTWLIYAAYLHARGLRGWRGTRAAVILVIAFASTLFTYFGVNLVLSGLHSYAGV
jgi:cytochrome c-type biogenesis protein CcsB